MFVIVFVFVVRVHVHGVLLYVCLCVWFLCVCVCLCDCVRMCLYVFICVPLHSALRIFGLLAALQVAGDLVKSDPPSIYCGDLVGYLFDVMRPPMNLYAPKWGPHQWWGSFMFLLDTS